MDRNEDLSLLCRVGTRLCALPLACVIETMRPLQIDPLAGAPDFVLGLSIVRGSPVPVVDAGRLVFGEASALARLVMLKVGERRVALGVDEVIGLRAVKGDSLQGLPLLLRNSDSEVVSAVGALDAELLTVLEAVRAVPDDVHTRVDAEALAS